MDTHIIEEHKRIMEKNLQINKDRGFNPYYYLHWRSDEFEGIDDALKIKNPTFDLNNFPDPGRYFNLEIFGRTEEQFKQFWKDLYGQQIIKFESFTIPGDM